MAVTLLNIADLFFWVALIMLLIRIVSSWFPELRQYQWMDFVAFCVDPYLNFFRRFIPPLGMIDISPIVAFFCLGIIEHSVKALIMVVFSP